jgi:RNA polymerase sigma factor (sigma-70 family)
MSEGIVFKNKENKLIYELLNKLIVLRNEKNKTKGKNYPKVCHEYRQHFDFLIKKFSYIPELHARRYMKYSNYPDLLQEGMLGLVMALENFDMNRSNNFFKIANWYVKTRIKRSANKFDVISVPMAVGKENPLYRVVEIPVMEDFSLTQSEQVEKAQQSKAMYTAISCLPTEYKKVFCYYYGVDVVNDEIVIKDNKKTISDISKELNLSRIKIKKIIDCANKKITSALI